MATVVAFHAHPDDEVLWTGGTLAMLAAEGHRVVIVVATDGVVGPADGAIGHVRLDELRASASVLGAARVVHLGYADSGHGPVLFPDPPGRTRFVRAGVEEAASRLADVLRAERAGVLMSYDRLGGYGHRDHVQVHIVGARAANLAGTARVLEATLPREAVIWVARLARVLRLTADFDPRPAGKWFSARSAITHSIDVRWYAAQKRAALATHRSQTTSNGRTARILRVLSRLPVPVFAVLFGREWYIEPGQSPLATRSHIL